MVENYPILFELLFSGAVLAFAVREVWVTRRTLRETRAKAARDAQAAAQTEADGPDA